MNVLMPQLGETVEEGTVTEWFKKPGDPVEKNETLFEVETDKVTTEVPALKAGILSKILVGEGETVDVGTVLAVIASEGDEADGETDEAAPAVEPATAPEAAAPTPAPAAKVEAAPRDKEGRSSPVVCKLLARHNLSADQITGSGGGGRITKQDVLAFVEGGAGVEGDAGVEGGKDGGAGSTGDFKPFTKIRKLTGDHMLRSLATSAHVTQAIEIDFHTVDAARSAHGAAWKEEQGFSLTYLPFIARAICLAIADYPNINATVEGDGLKLHRDINLAVAVDLNFEGLVAPVIRDAGLKSVADLAREINRLAGAARNGKLTPDEVTGGTYTISNNGSFGTLFTTPVINQPQVAILSVDKIGRKPVVLERDEIAVRPIGVLAQSFDHRAVDGAYAAAFLSRLREIIEGTDWSAELV